MRRKGRCRVKAKEYLEGIKRLDNIINSLIAEYETLKGMTMKITASTEGDRVQASGSQEKMADIVCKMIDCQNSINSNIDKYINMRKNILEVIQLLDNADHIAVLYKRYYEYKKWEQIACEMGLGWRGTLKLHGRALNAMDNILNDK